MEGPTGLFSPGPQAKDQVGGSGLSQDDKDGEHAWLPPSPLWAVLPELPPILGGHCWVHLPAQQRGLAPGAELTGGGAAPSRGSPRTCSPPSWECHSSHTGPASQTRGSMAVGSPLPSLWEGAGPCREG